MTMVGDYINTIKSISNAYHKNSYLDPTIQFFILGNYQNDSTAGPLKNSIEWV